MCTVYDFNDDTNVHLLPNSTQWTLLWGYLNLQRHATLFVQVYANTGERIIYIKTWEVRRNVHSIRT